MKPQDLFVGSVVCLKSGGPPMTVCRLKCYTEMGVETVKCAWFKDNDLVSALFTPGVLESIKDD